MTIWLEEGRKGASFFPHNKRIKSGIKCQRKRNRGSHVMPTHAPDLKATSPRPESTNRKEEMGGERENALTFVSYILYQLGCQFLRTVGHG